MASKSKKRRRVLGASCILAALIIAGSSFAWFTSKDEVTNRLTASADYNVSIIENFAPPKQWTPGQTVTKEEAVVNTGNVDAFVKQQITADMEVTVEVPVATAPVANKGYIALEPAEYGSIEAGSYVAWAPKADDIGRKIVYAMDTTGELGSNGHTTGDKTDFTPSETGLYIFRRAITTEKDTNDTTGNVTLKDTAYDYVGYYYVLNDENDPTKGGTYYKLNTIDKNSLVLAASGNGDLAQAPTVRYSIEETRTLKHVPMVYDKTNQKLTVTYDANRSSVSADIAGADAAAYNAYNKYLDDLKGATKWDNTRGANDYAGVGTDTQHTPTKSLDPANFTGLIDYDEFTTPASENKSTPADDLSNFSLDRLTERATETETILDNVSPGGDFTEDNWKTVYEKAVADRKTVNKGVRSKERLDNLKAELLGIIGADNGDAGDGLKQSNDYGFFYSSDLYSVDGTGTVTVAAPDVSLVNTSTYTGNGITNSVKNLTLDNMNDYDGNYSDALGNFKIANIDEGADKAIDADGDSLAKFSNEGTYFGAKFDYANADTTAGKLRDLWDEYVIATKKQVLVDAKIKLVNEAIAASADSTTDVGRTLQELQEILAALTSEKRVIDENLTTKKTAYENYVVNTIKKYIDEMNEDQKDINAANEVDKQRESDNPFNKSLNYKGDQSDATTYPGTKSSVVGNGETETLSEATLKQYLINAFGVAYKDTVGSEAAQVYTGEKYSTDSNDTTHYDNPSNAKWSTDTGADLYANIVTYSPKVTQTKIDNSLEETKDGNNVGTGVIKWKEDVELVGDATQQATDKTNIEKAPYYLDKKADMMKAKREKDVAADLTDYNTKKATAVGYADMDAEAQPIVIDVNLVNTEDNVESLQKDKWQYIADATGTHEYNFYYTSILGSGETSKLLIKSVSMGSNVDQNSFRDLKFDLNVGSESAQVVFDGDYAKSDAAKTNITGASPTEDQYLEGNKVVWAKDSGTAPTVDNPQGKASTEVNDTTYTKSGKLDGADSTNYTIKKVPATTVSGDSYIYQITVDANNVFYGNSVESGAEFKKVADPNADSLAFASTESKIVLD